MQWILVSAPHHPDHGGIGTYVRHWCAAAVEAGWDVHLVTRPGRGHPPGVTVHEVRTPDDDPDFQPRLAPLRALGLVRPYRYGLWSLAVAETLLGLDLRPDAIEFVDSRAEGFVSLTSRRVRRACADVPMVVGAHTPMFVEERINDADPSCFGRPVYHAWERAALQHADGLMLAGRGLLPDLPCVLPSCIVPLPYGGADRPCPDAVTDRVRGTPPTIVFVGTAQPRKGLDVWVRSLARVLAERPAVRAIIVGPDTPTAAGGRSMIDEAMSMIPAALGARIDWVGPCGHGQTIEMMRRAAMLVVPSRFDSFSYVAAEALDLGVPVLVTTAVGLVEHVPDLPRVAAGDENALAEAQLRMIDDPVGARSNAVRAAAQLRAACAPASAVKARQAFVRDLAGRSPAGLRTGPEVMDGMRLFLRAVERAEAGAVRMQVARLSHPRRRAVVAAAASADGTLS